MTAADIIRGHETDLRHNAAIRETIEALREKLEASNNEVDVSRTASRMALGNLKPGEVGHMDGRVYRWEAGRVQSQPCQDLETIEIGDQSGDGPPNEPDAPPNEPACEPSDDRCGAIPAPFAGADAAEFGPRIVRGKTVIGGGGGMGDSEDCSDDLKLRLGRPASKWGVPAPARQAAQQEPRTLLKSVIATPFLGSALSFAGPVPSRVCDCGTCGECRERRLEDVGSRNCPNIAP